MSLFLYHFFISLTSSVTLTQKEYDEIRKNPDTKLLVWLWDPWCEHCSRFRPTWQSFTSTLNAPDDVIVADINCQESQNLCLNLASPGYPKVIWISNDLDEPLLYDGPLNNEGLQSFTRKQFNFPFHQINKSEIQNYLGMTNTTSVFVYVCIKDSKNTLMKEIAYNYRNFDCIFLLIESDTQQFYVYRSPTNPIYFNEKWNYGNLIEFIDNNTYPLFPMLSATLFNRYKSRKEIFGLFYINQTQYNKVYQTALTISNKYPTSYIIFDQSEWLGQFMNVKSTDLPSFFIVDIDNSRWKKYDSKFSASNIVEWANSLDLNKIKWEGPGNGIFSDFWTQIYQLKASGQLWIMIFAIIMIIVTIGSFIFMGICLGSESESEMIKEPTHTKTD